MVENKEKNIYINKIKKKKTQGGYVIYSFYLITNICAYVVKVTELS